MGWKLLLIAKQIINILNKMYIGGSKLCDSRGTMIACHVHTLKIQHEIFVDSISIAKSDPTANQMCANAKFDIIYIN